MANATIFPPVNNIRMAPVKALLSKYNFYHFDDAIFRKQARPNQVTVPYEQKVQHVDQQQFWFYSTGTVTTSIYRINADNTYTQLTVLDVVEPLQLITYTYDYLTEGGEFIHTQVFGYRWYFNVDDYPEGHYFIGVHVAYEDGSITEDFVGESMWVRPKHLNTVLVKYWNSTDDFDIQFPLFGISFRQRFNSDFMSFEPASDDVVFTDQDDNLRRLYGNPYRIFKLNIGGFRGVPDWMVDKINRIFCCDTFLIEGKRFVKHESAKLDLQTSNNYPLSTATIQLREYFNGAAGANISHTTITLADIPGGYPFTWDGWRMDDHNSGNSIAFGPAEFNDHDDITDYIDYFNAVTVPQHELQGEFIEEDGHLKYVNGDEGEAFFVVTKAVTRTVYIEVTLNVTVASFTTPFYYAVAGEGAHVTVWGDGNIALIAEAGHTTLGSPKIVNQLYIYATTGNKTLRIYTDDKMTVLEFVAQTNKVTAINAATNVSVKLQRFWAQGQAIPHSLDQTFLARAEKELREINFSGSGFTGITANWISALHVGSYKPFRLLRYMYYNNNAISVANMDTLFNEVVSDMDYFSGWGQIRTVPQTPAAVPSGTSATARGTLTAVFWSLP